MLDVRCYFLQSGFLIIICFLELSRFQTADDNKDSLAVLLVNYKQMRESNVRMTSCQFRLLHVNYFTYDLI